MILNHVTTILFRFHLYHFLLLLVIFHLLFGYNPFSSYSRFLSSFTILFQTLFLYFFSFSIFCLAFLFIVISIFIIIFLLDHCNLFCRYCFLYLYRFIKK
ncbi:hypothetical protein C1646_725239 [Rhizophagus diaphanus]|nr:hypothetical protein C1646_725239 [Rhizophagus diaphanus] [Rhizophagus sp. MUCL 43196]